MTPAAKAAFEIWQSYRNALESKCFTDEWLVSVCQEEEEVWQDIYLKLTQKEGESELSQLGLSTNTGTSS